MAAALPAAMTFHEYPCDLCGARQAVEVPHAREYTGGQPLHICVECGLVYVKMRRTPEEVARSWSEQVFGARPEVTLARNYTARIPAVRARQTFVADFVDVNVGLRGRELCDVGTGEGQFLEMARGAPYFASVFGTEATPRYCQELRRQGIRCFEGTVEEFAKSVEGQAYRADIVTLMWTLECSGSCRSVLEASSRILKDGGHIVVATGSRILVPFKKPLHLYLDREIADTHPVRFSARTLRGLLAVSGFAPTAVNRYLDSDVLCMIARKGEAGAVIPWRGDDHRAVADFFERWHRENAHYLGIEDEAW
jgi:2-polyprenyl-3-methyl-5-hydroxy-6-metoxy-1,4-benzoquinol methylase